MLFDPAPMVRPDFPSLKSGEQVSDFSAGEVAILDLFEWHPHDGGRGLGNSSPNAGGGDIGGVEDVGGELDPDGRDEAGSLRCEHLERIGDGRGPKSEYANNVE